MEYGESCGCSKEGMWFCAKDCDTDRYMRHRREGSGVAQGVSRGTMTR